MFKGTAMITYEDAKKLIDTARSKEAGKPLQNNTRLFDRGDYFAVRLHETDIVRIYSATYFLYTGGWRTPTTKNRINNVIPGFIEQKNGIWYINGIVFYEGIGLNREGTVITREEIDKEKIEAAKKKLDKMVSKYIKGFANDMEKNGVKYPSSGDCWYCHFFASDAPDHLFGHFEEQYYVPSLLHNAIVKVGYKFPKVIWNTMNADMCKSILRAYFGKLKPALLDYMLKQEEQNDLE